MLPMILLCTILIPRPAAQDVDLQPLAAQAGRVVEAMEYLGAPISPTDKRAIQNSSLNSDSARGIEAIQKALDRYCLLMVDITPESRVKVAPGPAKPELVEQGWRVFLVKVRNQAGVTARLQAVSPNAVT